jgi:hypothetical protein
MQARESADLLREFVYLDEVSVYSLMASKDGMIAAELTDAQASSLQSEVGALVGANAYLARGEASSKVQSSESQSTQVLRKAIVQSTFRDLHSRVSDSLVIRPPRSTDRMPNVTTCEDLPNLGPDQSWIIDGAALERGCLVEMKVTLEVEPAFEARTVMAGFLDMVQDEPKFFGIDDLGTLGQSAMVSRMLDKLFSGLVPIRGRSTDYVVAMVGDHEYVVHRRIADQLSGQTDISELHLVGVAEQSLFWKDIRRVAFSGSTYSVLGRLNRESLQSSWTPMKLVESFGRVMPGLNDVVQEMNATILSTMTSAANSPDLGPRSGNGQRKALVLFAGLIADSVECEITEEELKAARVLEGASALEQMSPVDQWRSAFQPIAEFVEKKSGKSIDPIVASNSRTIARCEAAMEYLTPVPTTTTQTADPSSPADDSQRLLDAEIIGVYW